MLDKGGGWECNAGYWIHILNKVSSNQIIIWIDIVKCCYYYHGLVDQNIILI